MSLPFKNIYVSILCVCLICLANHNNHRGSILNKQARWLPQIWNGLFIDLLKNNKQLQAFVDMKDVFMELPTKFGKVYQLALQHFDAMIGCWSIQLHLRHFDLCLMITSLGNKKCTERFHIDKHFIYNALQLPWKSRVIARAQFEFAQRVTLGTSNILTPDCPGTEQ